MIGEITGELKLINATALKKISIIIAISEIKINDSELLPK